MSYSLHNATNYFLVSDNPHLRTGLYHQWLAVMAGVWYRGVCRSGFLPYRIFPDLHPSPHSPSLSDTTNVDHSRPRPFAAKFTPNNCTGSRFTLASGPSAPGSSSFLEARRIRRWVTLGCDGRNSCNKAMKASTTCGIFITMHGVHTIKPLLQ